MELKRFEMYSKINYNNSLKGCKYNLMVEDGTTLKFNRGRALEFSLQKAEEKTTLELENVNHKTAGDINIDGKEYNIKSQKCELVASGNSLVEKIENYIKEDASQGLIYIVEVNSKLIAIKMNWLEAKEFLIEFARVESTGKLRITTCDKKIYQWSMLHK
jgi:hypothetical protein